MKPPRTRAADPSPRPTAPAVVRRGELYRLCEVKRRLAWGEHAIRQARLAGLRLVNFGREKYCTGDDLLDFFARLADAQQPKPQEAGADG